MRKHKVFLSYAEADTEFADRLGRALASKGIQVPDQPNPGDDWIEWIRSELNASDLVVFIVPLHEGEGRHALAEIGAARMINKKILAVLPSQARYANSDVARVLSKGQMVNAERITPLQLADTIIASIPEELTAA